MNDIKEVLVRAFLTTAAFAVMLLLLPGSPVLFCAAICVLVWFALREMSRL